MSRWRKNQEHSLESWSWRASNKYCMQTQKRKYSVPSWEKRFCFVVGSMPWSRLLDAKKYISESDKVMKWNDSAGRKAFHSAKSRYWAKINGLPCKFSMPNPDIYIDNIDWDSKVDPQLFLDLEVAKEEKNNNVIDNSCQLILDQPIKPTGWDISCSDIIFNKSLTGMIVGDCGVGENNKNGINSWECSNYLGASDYNDWKVVGKKNENCRRRVYGNECKPPRPRCLNPRFQADHGFRRN